MNDILLVHVFDSFANLSHIVDDFCFRHGITFGRNSFEELTTGQTEEINYRDQSYQLIEIDCVRSDYSK